MKMKTVYIMRGVPGSGKSTAAEQIAGENGVIHSTDKFFYEDGVYRYDRAKLAENHQKNFEAFCESLRNEVPVVVLDNVNHRRSSFEPYTREARKRGYAVMIVEIEHPYPKDAAARNIHNIPEEHIRRLIETWEP